MIGIRSITVGLDNGKSLSHDYGKELPKFFGLCESEFGDNNLKIRTKRLVTSPINKSQNFTLQSSQSKVRWISDLASNIGIRWFCIPFDCSGSENNNKLNFDTAFSILDRNPNAFVNIIVSSKGHYNNDSIKRSAELIRRVSNLNSNGFDNFRLGISANPKPNTPFFPYSFHQGSNSFSIALETVNLFVDVIGANSKLSLKSISELLIEKLSGELRKLGEITENIESKSNLRFSGFDASLAPFPDGKESVGLLYEMLGLSDFGSSGTVFCTEFLTNVIKQSLVESGVESTGFNGVMLSVLEDDLLAKRASEKNYTIDSLSLFSTICGCGLDMIPIPGDTLSEEIASMIFDINAISTRLDKPLGIRLLPIPSKGANEMTDFNYDFLIDTRVMDIRNKFFNL